MMDMHVEPKNIAIVLGSPFSSHRYSYVETP